MSTMEGQGVFNILSFFKKSSPCDKSNVNIPTDNLRYSETCKKLAVFLSNYLDAYFNHVKKDLSCTFYGDKFSRDIKKTEEKIKGYDAVIPGLYSLYNEKRGEAAFAHKHGDRSKYYEISSEIIDVQNSLYKALRDKSYHEKIIQGKRFNKKFTSDFLKLNFVSVPDLEETIYSIYKETCEHPRVYNYLSAEHKKILYGIISNREPVIDIIPTGFANFNNPKNESLLEKKVVPAAGNNTEKIVSCFSEPKSNSAFYDRASSAQPSSKPTDAGGERAKESAIESTKEPTKEPIKNEPTIDESTKDEPTKETAKEPAWYNRDIRTFFFRSSGFNLFLKNKYSDESPEKLEGKINELSREYANDIGKIVEYKNKYSRLGFRKVIDGYSSSGSFSISFSKNLSSSIPSSSIPSFSLSDSSLQTKSSSLPNSSKSLNSSLQSYSPYSSQPSSWIKTEQDYFSVLRDAISIGHSINRYDKNIAPDEMKEEMTKEYCLNTRESLKSIAKRLSEKYKINVSSSTIRTYARKSIGNDYILRKDGSAYKAYSKLKHKSRLK